jgi:hypothetical protein
LWVHCKLEFMSYLGAGEFMAELGPASGGLGDVRASRRKALDIPENHRKTTAGNVKMRHNIV